MGRTESGKVTEQQSIYSVQCSVKLFAFVGSQTLTNLIIKLKRQKFVQFVKLDIYAKAVEQSTQILHAFMCNISMKKLFEFID